MSFTMTLTTTETEKTSASFDIEELEVLETVWPAHGPAHYVGGVIVRDDHPSSFDGVVVVGSYDTAPYMYGGRQYLSCPSNKMSPSS
jgi:hypothetical protein